ncbi:MAG: hypothetical protein ACE5GA_08475 [Candidatus Zixiibacteriota bacterium]
MTETTRLIRHFLATLAYRLGGVLQDPPDEFDSFSSGHEVRTPLEILHHMSELLMFADSFYTSERERLSAVSWREEIERFRDWLVRLDGHLAAGAPESDTPLEKIFQGPLADAMTHVGQLATLRRLAGSPIPAESFIRAEIRIGCFTF